MFRGILRGAELIGDFLIMLERAFATDNTSALQDLMAVSAMWRSECGSIISTVKADEKVVDNDIASKNIIGLLSFFVDKFFFGQLPKMDAPKSRELLREAAAKHPELKVKI